MPLFCQTSLGRRSGPSDDEALREEVHRFVELMKYDKMRAFEIANSAVELCKNR